MSTTTRPLPDLDIVDRGAIPHAPAMFPSAVRTPSAIVVAFSTVPDGWPGGEVHVTRSVDGGASWSAPRHVAVPHQGEAAAFGALGLMRRSNGTLLLPVNISRWKEGESTSSQRLALRLLRSTNDGLTWTHDEPVAIDFEWPAVYGTLLERPAGELLWPVWGRLNAGERWRSALLSSVDGGDSWRVMSTIAYDPEARLRGRYAETGNSQLGLGEIHDPDFRPHDPNDGFNETSLCALSDGRLLAVLRQQGVQGDHLLSFFRSWSDDGGASWSAYEPMGFSGMSPALFTLPDSRLLLFSRRCAPDGSGVEPGVEFRLGTPDGANWGAAVALQDAHGRRPTSEYQCGYPAPIADGNDVRVFFYSYLRSGERYVAWNLLRIHS